MFKFLNETKPKNRKIKTKQEKIKDKWKMKTGKGNRKNKWRNQPGLEAVKANW
jgi:hypothetical protein